MTEVGVATSIDQPFANVGERTISPIMVLLVANKNVLNSHIWVVLNARNTFMSTWRLSHEEKLLSVVTDIIIHSLTRGDESQIGLEFKIKAEWYVIYETC